MAWKSSFQMAKWDSDERAHALNVYLGYVHEQMLPCPIATSALLVVAGCGTYRRHLMWLVEGFMVLVCLYLQGASKP